jgi:tartrate dehydratase beta subunit/fumarate hydratase class I family protein
VTTILPFLKNDAVFEPEATQATQATQAMSAAFEAACQALKLSGDAAREREAVAVRIIELARRGERDPVRLSQSVLRDAGAG